MILQNVSHNGLAELSSDEPDIYEGLGDLADFISFEDLVTEAGEPEQVSDPYQMVFTNQNERKRKRQEDNDEIK